LLSDNEGIVFKKAAKILRFIFCISLLFIGNSR